MQIITTTDQLQQLTERLSKHDFVAVDTEFMRESTYWPDLCLIQIASEDEEAIIDPLANGINLEPLFHLMSDKSTIKVFHAARQDVEIFHKLSGKIPEPLFDTQVAAMVCGYGEQVGYSQLVKKITDTDLDKSSRFTDWAKRPLSEKQLTYAIGDVTHLRVIYRSLQSMLEKSGRAAWLAEEMETLTSVETYVTEPEHAWKRMKMRVKSRKALGILIELAEWRESLAQRANIPRGRVMKDDALFDIANQAPKNTKDLGQLRAVSDGFARSEKGREVISAVERGKAKDIDSIPPLKKGNPLDAQAVAICELLRVLLKAIAAENGVAPKMIATASDLERLAQSDEADIPALQGWRYDLFGEPALKIKRGELLLTVKDQRVQTIEV
ncbi:MAG: ribonuclease D [Rhodomicrobium sp.]|nr:MAG: ribonuclease D [Rhodomicrobium sp.]